MDYEKSYKEALERARDIKNGNPNSSTANVVCEEIFPELKESEDERIRKELIELIAKHCGKTCEMYLWLEKQGEQMITWSREDEIMLKDALEFIETGWTINGTSHLVYWLKSIKERIKRE